MRRLLLVYIVLLTMPLAGYGQGYYFNHFGVDDGLSNTSVLCSAQDKNGFLWFGTKDGLNRFDGYNFKQFYSDTDSNNGLGSNFIHSLMVDRNNHIWVGTDQGMYIFNPYLERFSTFNAEHQGEILQMEEDQAGNVWFISNNQLFCFYPTNGQLVRQTAVDEQVVSAFAFDARGDVWIGTSQYMKNLRTGLTHILPTLHNAPQWIEKIYLDDKGIFWIGSSKHGVYQLNPATGKITHSIPSIHGHSLFVRDIQQADGAHFWIGTESGVIVYNKNTGQQEALRHEIDHPWSLSDNAVYTIAKDHQGGLWVGTFFGGLNYFHRQHNRFQKIFPRFSASSIQGHAVREIVQDNRSRIWIGTEDNGLYAWNPQNDQFKAFTPALGLSHTNIHGLAMAGDSLLVGTFDRGLDIIDTRTDKLIKHFDTRNTRGALSNDFIFFIYKTKRGRILLATARGLCEFFPGKDTFALIREVPTYIFYTSIFEDADENLWLATWRDGLYHINYSTGHTKVFLHDRADSTSLNSNRVNRIFQDSFNNLWIATESGLAQWNSSGKAIRRFTKKDGLPSNLILTMQEDSHRNLWITTTRGLVRMHLPDYRMHLFDKESGLLDLQFNYNSTFKDQKGHFYFGSSRGVITFHPDAFLTPNVSQTPSPLYITQVQSLQRELSVGHVGPSIDTAVTYLREINLAHDESTISIHFAALNFISSQSTAYMYMLEGFDKDWTLLRNSHSAHFTKIPPGSYVFRVKAVDGNGQSISAEKTLKIRINPPIWASAPAFLLYILLSGVLIYVVIGSYDRKIKEKNRRRLEAIKAHRERELYKTRMDFFARVAHDIKTPLTLIKAPLERLMDGHNGDDKTNRLLNTMQQNTERLVNLTNQLLDFRKIESSEYNLRLEKQSINQLVSDRLQEFQPVFTQRNLTFSYHCEQVIDAFVDVEVIIKIIDNLLTNAVKYAASGVAVILEKDGNEKWFSVTVQNDGRRLSQEEVNAIFKPFHRSSEHYQIEGTGLGLALSHSFAELHRGVLFFLDNSKNLNIFVLRIPIKETYD